MTEVVVVCEGRTEESFINGLVQPILATKAVYLRPRLIPTSPASKGGALTRDRVVRSLCRALRERDDTYVTTFFDLYGLPSDFPGPSANRAPKDSIARCEQIENSLHNVVTEQAQRRSDRFIPHIQPHEFEALLFSDTNAFVRVDSNWRRAESDLAKVVKRAGGPEHVNDGPDTHPFARLKRAIPSYRKVADGVNVAAVIGLPRIRAECHHFASWLDRIENLPPLRPKAGHP